MTISTEVEELKAEISVLNDVIRGLRLKNSQHAVERGKLLQRLEKYEPSENDGFSYQKKSKEELRLMAENEVARQRGLPTADSTGTPKLVE